jgi:hypothetical protein
MQDHEAAQAEAERVELARRDAEERAEAERYRRQEDSYDRSDDSIDDY